MAEFTHVDLQAAQKARKMTRWQLAGELGVSEDTLERWETGKQRPDPDDVGNIERALAMPGLWHRWMLSTYDSYRERNVDVLYVNHPTALLARAKHEIADFLATYLQVIIVALLAVLVVLPLAWHTIRDSFCSYEIRPKGEIPMYHEINEVAAKRAHDANSHYEFKPGKAGDRPDVPRQNRLLPRPLQQEAG